MILAGHGKDPRLVQVELPLVPNVGDRIRENLNPKDDSYHLDSLIREGEFIQEISSPTGKYWQVKVGKDGEKLSYFSPNDSEIIERAAAPVLVEKEINQSLPEQTFKVGDRVDTESCGKNLEIIEINGDWLVCRNQKEQTFRVNQKFCRTSSGLEALEPSAIQPESPARSKQSDIQTSAKMLKPSTVQTSLKSQSLEILEKSPHQQELISTQGDFPVQEPQTQEPKQDSYIQSLLSGLNISELSTKGDPDSLSSKTQLQLLITHCEQYLEDSEWSDIVGMIHKSYKQLSLEVPKKGSDCLSLPTLTTNKGVKSRSSGQSKCEKWFRDKGLLLDTQCLSPQMMAVLFGFPMEWTKCLWDVQGVQTGELDLDICLEEPLTLTAVQQSLSESCTSIAVLVGTIVKPKFNGGKGKVISSTKKKISVSWFGANNVVTYTIAEFRNNIDILSVPSPSIDEANLGNSSHAIATKPSESVAISRIDDVLVGNDLSLDERLAYLQSERDRLIASGASPRGIWINCSKVPNREFKQAVWKSDKPRAEWGDKKSKYIGEFNKEAHISAIAQHKAGQELRKIEREIKKLQVKS